MKYYRLIYLVTWLIFGFNLSAQVTIGSGDTPHRGAVLELKSEDKGFLGPRVQLESTSSPDPIQNPANGLLVFNIGDKGTGKTKVEKEKFYFWSEDQWVEFVYEDVLEAEIQDLLKNLGIPRSAIFHLDGDKIIDNRTPSKPVMGMYNVMFGLGLGERTRIYLKETDNETEGNVVFAEDQYRNAFLIFKKGTYSITFAYQFIPSTYASPNSSTPDTKCTASSYFVDFPLESSSISGDRARIHNVAYHATGSEAHHGGSISYVIKIEQDNRQWQVQFGAGQSGANCNDASNNYKAIAGFSLMNDNTFVLVSRIGD
ncbi:MAG: hypothetical protein E6767_11075 [Dysgonomonas sp.]|nr:hypothetical protein [Dysgonomonas sp.]